jgi:hypothetical protein
MKVKMLRYFIPRKIDMTSAHGLFALLRLGLKFGVYGFRADLTGKRSDSKPTGWTMWNMVTDRRT